MTKTLRMPLLAGALAALAAPAMAETWDMPTPYGDSVFHTQNIIQFAEDVTEATGGECRQDPEVHTHGEQKSDHYPPALHCESSMRGDTEAVSSRSCQ